MITTVPHIAKPKNLPFLKAICWQTEDIQHFTEDEMLDRYERGWNYRGVLADLEGEELSFLHRIARVKGSWLAIHV